jgi:hypothetical protein
VQVPPHVCSIPKGAMRWRKQLRNQQATGEKKTSSLA